MPAIRITINTDAYGDDFEAARKAVAERLPDLIALLETGKYVGSFCLGGIWFATDPETGKVEKFPSRRAAHKWIREFTGWSVDLFSVEPSVRNPLCGDVDEL